MRLNIAEGIINHELLLGGAHLLPDLLLHLEAVFLLLFLALLHRLVAADALLDFVAHGAQLLALAVLAHLPGHRLALLVVDVLLGLGRVRDYSSHFFMGSVWQFCFSTGKGNSLVNFSQYLLVWGLQISSWTFLGVS